ncbi:hypothetical protein L3X38_015400 [Prunus dulcis]|uniref:Uncharacterized protein n=1 Tax=Prunus dulcis TaxID=3755 RepID=A0AAD4W3C7_PRUDU|nr:hypothetical protein L3X38_015400 [Prunus dulcis]
MFFKPTVGYPPGNCLWNSLVIYDNTSRVSRTPELCGVRICIQVDYIFRSPAREIDGYEFQAGHSMDHDETSQMSSTYGYGPIGIII